MIAALHLARPEALLLLAVFVPLWFAVARSADPRRAWSRAIEPHLLDALLLRSERGARLQPVHLLAVTWVVGTLALAGPSWRRAPAPFAEDNAGLVIVMEVTETMTRSDVQPSRLQRAAQKVGDLLALRGDVDVALIAYAGSAHRVLPLTKDSEIVKEFASALSPEVMPAPGHAAAAAIAAANAELERARRPGSIVFLGDGVAPDQLDAIREAGSVPVHVLAIGAPPTDPASLEELASVTGGVHVLVTADGADVERLAAAATSRIGSVTDEDEAPKWQDDGHLFVWLVAAALLAWARRGWSIALPGRDA